MSGFCRCVVGTRRLVGSLRRAQSSDRLFAHRVPSLVAPAGRGRYREVGSQRRRIYSWVGDSQMESIQLDDVRSPCTILHNDHMSQASRRATPSLLSFLTSSLFRGSVNIIRIPMDGSTLPKREMLWRQARDMLVRRELQLCPRIWGPNGKPWPKDKWIALVFMVFPTQVF